MLTVSPTSSGEPLADLAALLGDVESSRHRIGQTQDAEPEPIFAPLMRLLDELVFLERAEQPRNAVDLCTPMSAASSVTPASP